MWQAWWPWKPGWGCARWWTSSRGTERSGWPTQAALGQGGSGLGSQDDRHGVLHSRRLHWDKAAMASAARMSLGREAMALAARMTDTVSCTAGSCPGTRRLWPRQPGWAWAGCWTSSRGTEGSGWPTRCHPRAGGSPGTGRRVGYGRHGVNTLAPGLARHRAAVYWRWDLNTGLMGPHHWGRDLCPYTFFLSGHALGELNNVCSILMAELMVNASLNV